MGKLLTLLIALGAMIAVTASSFGTSMMLTGVGKAPGAAAYQGPGDVQTTGWIAWWGLRAFSAATAGTKAANICNSGDANCADVNTLTNGNFDVATATGAPLNCGGTGGTCTIKTLYDKSGTNCTTACDFSQATIANRPTLVLNCTGSLPCIGWQGGANQSMTTANLTSNFNQPFSLSIVYDRTGNTGSFTDVISQSGPEFFGSNSANTASLYANGFNNFTASDSALHAINGTFNASSGTNAINMDGTLSNYTTGSSALASGAAFVFGKTSNAAPTANIGEAGFNSNDFATAIAGTVCHNQRLYWGTGGSC